MAAVVLYVVVITLLLGYDASIKLCKIFAYDRSDSYVSRSAPRIARRLLRLAQIIVGLRVDVTRRADMPQRMLILANHQSVIDIVVIMAAFRHHSVRFVAKKELKYGVPGVSEVLRTQRHALIDRHGDFGATLRALRALARNAVGTVSPVIFPEGTRSRDGSLLPFHVGAIRMLLQGRSLPIVVVALDGGHSVATFFQVLRLRSDTHYRLAVVDIYDPPSGKDDVAHAVKRAQNTIAKQIEMWRRPTSL